MTTPQPLSSRVGQGGLELEVAYCVGGVISPLLANIALHVLDAEWTRGGRSLGVLIRYCDDCVTRMRGRWRCRRSNLPSNAARVMEVGPPWSPCRRRSQTTARCAGE